MAIRVDGQPNLSYIVVNFLNVGTNYGKQILGQTKSAFNWEGVRRCVQHLANDRHLKVIGVILDNFKGDDHRTPVEGVPEDIRRSCCAVQEVPRLINNRSADDEMTIKLAFKRNCRYLDNDNYRDWRKGHPDPAIRSWLEGEGRLLHVGFCFDAEFGCFETLEGKLQEVEQVESSASAAVAPKVADAAQPPQQRQKPQKPQPPAPAPPAPAPPAPAPPPGLRGPAVEEVKQPGSSPPSAPAAPLTPRLRGQVQPAQPRQEALIFQPLPPPPPPMDPPAAALGRVQAPCLEMRESVCMKVLWRQAAPRRLERLHELLVDRLEEAAVRKGLVCEPCKLELNTHTWKVSDAVSEFIKHLGGDPHRRALHNNVDLSSPCWQCFRVRSRAGLRELWFDHLDGHITYDREEMRAKRVGDQNSGAGASPARGTSAGEPAGAGALVPWSPPPGAPAPDDDQGYGNGNNTMMAAFDEAAGLWESQRRVPGSDRLDLTRHRFDNGFEWKKWAATREFTNVLTADADSDEGVMDLSFCSFFFFVHHEAKGYDGKDKRYFAIVDHRDGIEVLFDKRKTKCGSLLFQAYPSGELLGRGSPRPASAGERRAIQVQTQDDVLLLFNRNRYSRRKFTQSRPSEGPAMKEHVLRFLPTLGKRDDEDMLDLVRRHSTFTKEHQFDLKPQVLWTRWWNFLCSDEARGRQQDPPAPPAGWLPPPPPSSQPPPPAAPAAVPAGPAAPAAPPPPAGEPPARRHGGVAALAGELDELADFLQQEQGPEQQQPATGPAGRAGGAAPLGGPHHPVPGVPPPPPVSDLPPASAAAPQQPPPTRLAGPMARQPPAPPEARREERSEWDEFTSSLQEAVIAAREERWRGLWKWCLRAPEMAERAGTRVQAPDGLDVQSILFSTERLKEFWNEKEPAQMWGIALAKLEKHADSLAAKRDTRNTPSSSWLDDAAELKMSGLYQ